MVGSSKIVVSGSGVSSGKPSRDVGWEHRGRWWKTKNADDRRSAKKLERLDHEYTSLHEMALFARGAPR